MRLKQSAHGISNCLRRLFVPQNEAREHVRNLGFLAARLGFRGRCRSGHSACVVQDLPHPAVSIDTGVLPDLLQSGPYCFLTWLTCFFWETDIKKSLNKVVSLLDTYKSRVAVTWDVAGPRR